MQTLFDVQCSPQEAAYYLLDQLLIGFDEDKNWKNARQVVALGGLSLLAKRMEIGDASEKCNAGAMICCCIRVDGSCRHYLALNLNKESVISLVLEKNIDYNNHAFALLTELLCLQRTSVTKFLNELMNGWSSLNTMQILLIYLQKAQPEQRPMIATIIFQLDLLDDEDSATEIWQRKTAVAFLTGRNKKFVAALSESTARSIPCLAQASLVTIAWMSSFLHSIVDLPWSL
ncbi:hypothetical protein POM88_020478 [Heracleum sosnowskyi]|uniref:Putative E3 ubiquitin-protein ligase LIN ARM-like domain-containing protein n=1 Tax=Heracleum sosnowskyi TaxID=360622 RepID=A0AAD8MSX5_9APIA|nr:hypothetical protein POM88_020478 [Heracleum sosnowskyi]